MTEIESLIYAALMHHGTPKTVGEFERAARTVAEMLERREAGRAQSAAKVDLRQIAEQAGIKMNLWNQGAASLAYSEGCEGVAREHLEKFAFIYGYACWNAALAANPPHMQGFVSRAIGSLFEPDPAPAPPKAKGDRFYRERPKTPRA